MRTLVVGLGNPILGDDGVGWRIVQELQTQGDQANSIELDCLSLGGLRLMERMLGYERVILVDALLDENTPPGEVRVFPLDVLPNPSAGHTTSAHDVSLQTALEMAQRLGWQIPDLIWVVGVTVNPEFNFSEVLSPPVAAAIPKALLAVQELLERSSVQGGANDLP